MARGITIALVEAIRCVFGVVDLVWEVLPPPPLFVNENLDPEGEVYFDDVGVGDVKDSPPPPLLNENEDFDGDVYCFVLLFAVVEDTEGDVYVLCIFVGFVCIELLSLVDFVCNK